MINSGQQHSIAEQGPQLPAGARPRIESPSRDFLVVDILMCCREAKGEESPRRDELKSTQAFRRTVHASLEKLC